MRKEFYYVKIKENPDPGFLLEGRIWIRFFIVDPIRVFFQRSYPDRGFSRRSDPSKTNRINKKASPRTKLRHLILSVQEVVAHFI